MKIYVHDTEPGCRGWARFWEYLDGMRYMAVADENYPYGTIMCYGRTPEAAMRRAVKMVANGWSPAKRRKPILVEEVDEASS